jgi:flagellar protein FlbD
MDGRGFRMVPVTRLNGKKFYVNPDLITFIEATPDTVITLTDGRKLVVSEDADTVIQHIIEYRTSIYVRLPVIIENGQEGGE